MDKKSIITRLFKEGHINLDELLVLMDKQSTSLENVLAPSPGTIRTPWPYGGGTTAPVVPMFAHTTSNKDTTNQ